MVDVKEVNVDNLLNARDDIEDAKNDMLEAFNLFRNMAEQARDVVEGARAGGTSHNVLKYLTDAIGDLDFEAVAEARIVMNDLVQLADNIEYEQ